MDSKALLYHGSSLAGIKVLEPQATDLFTGKVVFASPDIRFALAMIYGSDQELGVGYFSNSKTDSLRMYIDELQPAKLELLNRSGYLYHLEASDDFKASDKLWHVELVSHQPQPVLKQVKIANVLAELAKYDLDIVGYDDVLAALEKRGMNKRPV